jgi:hypothetical protein
MTFYQVCESIDVGATGNYPQVEAIFNPHLSKTEEIASIYPVSGRFAKTTPLPKFAMTSPDVVLTDLLSFDAGPLSNKLLVSERLGQHLMTSSVHRGIQFLVVQIAGSTGAAQRYYLCHPYKYFLDYVNFERSEVRSCLDWVIGERLSCPSQDFFSQLCSCHPPGNVVLFKPAINNQVAADLFCLSHYYGGKGFIVSSRLKTILEKAAFTGIDFMSVIE